MLRHVCVSTRVYERFLGWICSSRRRHARDSFIGRDEDGREMSVSGSENWFFFRGGKGCSGALVDRKKNRGEKFVCLL